MSEDNKIVLTLHDEETEAKAGLAQAGLNADAAALAAEEERKKAEAAAAAKTPVFVDDSVLTDEERKQYEESLKNMGDYNNIINTATEEAEKRGLARGREEGKIETIKALIATGVSMESLASALNLSEKEIKSLVSQ
jgi:predicted transposase/invertase (TIGR01784 family)